MSEHPVTPAPKVDDGAPGEVAAEAANTQAAPGTGTQATPAAGTPATPETAVKATPPAQPEEGVRPYDADLPEKLKEFMRSGWIDAPLEVSRRPEADHHARRRAALSAAFPGETLVIPTGREKVRANDTTYRFRPGSDFMWLTGEHDPDSVLIIRPDGEATLYIRPRSPRDTDEFFRNARYGELWIGRRHTLEEKATELGIATASLADLGDALASLAPAKTRVLRGYDPAVDRAVLPYGSGDGGGSTDLSGGSNRDRELAERLSELRLVKDEWEIAQLQAAVDATVRGFEDVARVLPADRPVDERLLEGVFALRARCEGNDLGYLSIVGAGAHATILHWNRNTGKTKPGELILMDMGVEAHTLYTADVTRTLPVNGRFSPAQKDIYDLVYAAQQAGMDAVAPGVRYEDVALACNRVLAEGLYELKLLPCTPEEALDKESQVFKRWTLHGFGHMLGLDVHDCSHARKEMYRDGSLGEGYVITVEPGLYFQPEDELVPEELRGIGIRIEDDVLVTAGGARNLSAGLPRAPEDVETWLAEQREAGPRLP
ncbi:MAG TPA: aminopeptidase P family protein [Micromonosporaceae bacterium]|nr:aminopeptidase P family protein [Micromonosporaceae bacterium]